jgi:hypothetical protein
MSNHFIEFDIDEGFRFLNDQMRTNPELVQVVYQGGPVGPGGPEELGDLGPPAIYWDRGQGWTNAVTEHGYATDNIHATIGSKTDVEYPQPDGYRTGPYVTKKCSEDCEGCCCCCKKFPFALDGQFDDVEFWPLDFEVDPVCLQFGRSHACQPRDRRNPDAEFCSYRGLGRSAGSKNTFGAIQFVANQKCCGISQWTRTRQAMINDNRGTPREYEVVRVYQKSPDGIIDHKLLGVSNPGNIRYTGLVPVSFRIPHDDPQYNKAGGGDPLGGGTQLPGGGSAINVGYRLQQRCWMYDVSLTTFAHTLAGKFNTSQKMLQRAFVEQEKSQEDEINGLKGKIYPFIGRSFVDSTTGQTHNDAIFRPFGSIPFSFDQYIGLEFTPPYFRTGSNAWLGAAACHFMLTTGNNIFLPNVIAMADWMLTLQVHAPSDPRDGLFTGGEGSFAGDAYIFTSGARTWCSSEHNFDCHMFYRYLAILTGDPKYTKAWRDVERGMMRSAWLPDESRFAQGVRLAGDGTAGSFQDKAFALDMWTWGGMFLTSIQQWGKAKAAFFETDPIFRRDGIAVVKESDPEHYNMTFESGAEFSGHSTYVDGEFINGDLTYPNAPENIWPEGTWGYIMLARRLGLHDEADFMEDSMARIQKLPNMGGGIFTYSRTNNSLPYEQHTWPATNPVAWGIVTKLDPNYTVFPIGTAIYEAANAELNVMNQRAVSGETARFISKIKQVNNFTSDMVLV